MAVAVERFGGRRLCVAPMMEWTDRHCRYLLRLVAPHTLLYTEMVTANALVHGDAERLLAHDPAEYPVALQLGGSEPAALATAARLGAEAGFQEINLNVGCPSPRVKRGRFGACLMEEPDLVADCVIAMREAVAIPVTVKTRTGVDDSDSEPFLHRFVERVARTGCETLIVHARKAWLSGLSPKQNRELPPLDYGRVARLKQAFADLEIVLNGGLTEPSQLRDHAAAVDGFMIGRAAYHNPFVLHAMERVLFGDTVAALTREAVVRRFLPYLEARLAEGVRLHAMTRHMLGLFLGQPGARAWRRALSENGVRRGAGVEVVHDALNALLCAA
ncbi:MAG: tRNA dihydrouridine(20/20a) synthase DusA [Pseudomonadota bacterium]